MASRNVTTRSGNAAALTAALNDQNLNSLSGTVETQAGATYAVVYTDQNKLIELNNASMVCSLDSIATINSAIDTDGWRVTLRNINAADATVDTTDSIDGASSITLSQYESVTLQIDTAGASWAQIYSGRDVTLDAAIADIATNTADIATNTADIATNTADIATNVADIATNAADIATNVSNISAIIQLVQQKVATTSGTSKTITFAATPKRAVISAYNVSDSGSSSSVRIRLNSSASYQITLLSGTGASSSANGVVDLTNITGTNTWMYSYWIDSNGTQSQAIGAFALPSALANVAIVTDAGSGFDAGTFAADSWQ